MIKEEQKVAAGAFDSEPPSALDPARQSHSEGFMKSMDRKALANAFPKIGDKARAGAAAFEDDVNPLDDVDVQVAPMESTYEREHGETLEERKLRLERRRDTLKDKMRKDEEAKNAANAPLDIKRDTGDVFRNT